MRIIISLQLCLEIALYNIRQSIFDYNPLINYPLRICKYYDWYNHPLIIAKQLSRSMDLSQNLIQDTKFDGL